MIKQFLLTILFGLLAFSLIFVIIDLMENLDDFIDHSVHFYIILEYYLVFIPEIIKLMLPVAVLLSVLFTVGKMSDRLELTAFKSSGVSLYRFAAPFLITGFLISIGAVYFGGYVVPLANKHKVYIEEKYLKKGIVYIGNNIFFLDSPNRIVSIAYYDVANGQANRVSIETFAPNNLTHLIHRIDAQRMRYDTSDSKWIAYEGIERTFGRYKVHLKKFNKIIINNLNFKPKEVIEKQNKPEELTLTQLKKYADNQIRAGNDATRILIAYHSRFAFAFASFIVILLGIPIASDKRRGGLAIQFGISLLVTFVYLGFMKISQAFGKNGVLNPIITAWLANFIFLIIALFYFLRTKK